MIERGAETGVTKEFGVRLSVDDIGDAVDEVDDVGGELDTTLICNCVHLGTDGVHPEGHFCAERERCLHANRGGGGGADGVGGRTHDSWRRRGLWWDKLAAAH